MKIYHLTEDINEIDKAELDNLLKGDYSEAYQNALDGMLIYKGMFMTLDHDKAYHFKPLKNRESANTLNYYTLWMNNSKDWSSFPKRTVICTIKLQTAKPYGDQVFVILPKNGTKIGVCPDFDLWESFDFKGGMPNADDVNMVFHSMFYEYFKKSPESYNDLVDMLKNIKVDDESISFVERRMKNSGMNYDVLIEVFKEHGAYGLFKLLFSPDPFKITDIEGLMKYKSDNLEVWFDNEFIAIDYENMDNVLK